MTQVVLRTLFVNTWGTRLVLDHDAVMAITDDRPPRRLPLLAIESIVVCKGVNVSTPLLVRCAEDGRLVAFLSRYGKPQAFVLGATSGRGALRRLQYQRHFDAESRARAASIFVAGKINQMQWAMRQWARDADASRAKRLRNLADEVTRASQELDQQDRQVALGIEGQATKKYYRGIGLALRNANFDSRTRRPPKDPVNATLSFLYGMMRIAVAGAVETVGLDAYCGFLHGDRDGQPSFVLDLLEEFRPEMDRVAVTLFNRGQLSAKHFDESIVHGFSLTEQGRETVMTALHEYRTRSVSLQGYVEPVPFAAVPLIQAHIFSNALRSGSDYSPHRQRVT